MGGLQHCIVLQIFACTVCVGREEVIWEKSRAWEVVNISESGGESCWDSGGLRVEAALQKGDVTSGFQLCCVDGLGCLTSVQVCTASLNRRKVITIN